MFWQKQSAGKHNKKKGCAFSLFTNESIFLSSTLYTFKYPASSLICLSLLCFCYLTIQLNIHAEYLALNRHLEDNSLPYIFAYCLFYVIKSHFFISSPLTISCYSTFLCLLCYGFTSPTFRLVVFSYHQNKIQQT